MEDFEQATKVVELLHTRHAPAALCALSGWESPPSGVIFSQLPRCAGERRGRFAAPPGLPVFGEPAPGGKRPNAGFFRNEFSSSASLPRLQYNAFRVFFKI